MADKKSKAKSKIIKDEQPQAFQTYDAINNFVGMMMINDTFMNQLARTGFGSVNLMEGTQYVMTRLTQNYNLMNIMYRNNWIAQRIVDTVPKDMTKNWINYISDIKPEEVDLLQRATRKTRLRSQIQEGLRWGRLYGGAAGLLLLKNQGDILDQPLDLDSIMPGDYAGMMILDRWSGIYPQLDLVDDIEDPEFGLPMFYNVTNTNGEVVSRVHHSRVIRFIGISLPEIEKQTETYWGESVIEPAYEEIKKRDNTSANIAALIFQARLKVLKLKDTDVLLAGSNKKAQKDLNKTLSAQNYLQSNQGMQVIGAEDDFKTIDYTYSGLNDIYESFMMDIAGATQIPVTKLFGRSPAGMNATGESDMRNYYEFIENEQEAHLRPALEKLLPVLCMSTLGYVPDDIDFSFNPVATPTEKELADTVKSKSDAVYGAHDRGLVSDKIAMKELKQMGDDTGIFTNITDEDINAASNETGGGLQFPNALPGEEEQDESPEE